MNRQIDHKMYLFGVHSKSDASSESDAHDKLRRTPGLRSTSGEGSGWDMRGRPVAPAIWNLEIHESQIRQNQAQTEKANSLRPKH